MLSASTILAMLAIVGSAASMPKQARQSTNFGDATWFDPGVGACGFSNTASDFIAAVSASMFDSFPGAGPNPNTNPICGRTATVHFQGASTTVTIVDRCVGCAFSDIDLSPAAFGQLADPSVGRIQVSWNLN